MDNLCLIGAGILALLLIPKDNNKNNELEQTNKNEELALNLEELKNELQEDKLEEELKDELQEDKLDEELENLENIEEELENLEEELENVEEEEEELENLEDKLQQIEKKLEDNSQENQNKGGDTSSFMESLITDNISDTSMSADNQIKGGDTSNNKTLNINKYDINKLFKQKQLDSYESDLSENLNSNLSRQYNFNKKNL